jgi:hypothetical protein
MVKEKEEDNFKSSDDTIIKSHDEKNEKVNKSAKSFPDEFVLKLLFDEIGRPVSFDKIVVNNVFDNKFRINIFDIDKIDSYFLSISNDGKIIKSTPSLSKVY